MAVRAKAVPPSPSEVSPNPAMKMLARNGPITHQNRNDSARQAATAAKIPNQTEPVA